MHTDQMLSRAREAFERRSWTEAFESFSAARGSVELGAADLERLATAAYLIGQDETSDDALEAAHLAYLADGDPASAGRCAFWLGMMLFNRGETARGGGWIARGHRVLEGQPRSAAHGYLLVPTALQALESGDVAAAGELFEEVGRLGREFDERDLEAFGRLGLGQSMVASGDVAGGLGLLDEVMVSVEAEEVSAMPSGIIYCAVIEVCRDTFEFRRAQEWTEALTAWCERQPDLVPYRGNCLVHRSEVLQLRGDWDAALQEALRAKERLAGRGAVGAAHYQEAELHRLRGEFDAAEAAFRRASEQGAPVQPGLARLRLAQGDVDAAAAAIDRALAEEPQTPKRAELLAARAEVLLGAGEVEAARGVAAALNELASSLEVPMVAAVAAHVEGAVLLADGEPGRALPLLRSAWQAWSDLRAPYEAARVRVLVGLACGGLGDVDGAELELAAARAEFQRVGARPDLEALDRQLDDRDDRPGGLTEREVEVLRAVAAGRTNRAIADELVISEHTVARHVQNIFAKLGVSSRTAAAAFAFEHGLATGDRHGAS